MNGPNEGGHEHEEMVCWPNDAAGAGADGADRDGVL